MPVLSLPPAAPARSLVRLRPRFRRRRHGVKFADVTAGSPAAKAGFQAGDIMVEWDGKPIQNLYDFTYALRGKKPGDEVTVKVPARRQARRSQSPPDPPSIGDSGWPCRRPALTFC